MALPFRASLFGSSYFLFHSCAFSTVAAHINVLLINNGSIIANYPNNAKVLTVSGMLSLYRLVDHKVVELGDQHFHPHTNLNIILISFKLYAYLPG